MFQLLQTIDGKIETLEYLCAQDAGICHLFSGHIHSRNPAQFVGCRAQGDVVVPVQYPVIGRCTVSGGEDVLFRCPAVSVDYDGAVIQSVQLVSAEVCGRACPDHREKDVGLNDCPVRFQCRPL